MRNRRRQALYVVEILAADGQYFGICDILIIAVSGEFFKTNLLNGNRACHSGGEPDRKNRPDECRYSEFFRIIMRFR
ncbi:MAG: hypothetical protein C4563_08280 [Desulfobulbus sp.]|nr:MAG: hypothetical protein C4563_08280 [Desulfobulbus sp.]